MAKTVGIDLGTTNSVVAVMEGGEPTVIANAEGGRTTPSVVAFTRTGERLVGQLARRQAAVNPENTVYSIKRFMGRLLSEVSTEAKQVPYKVVAGKDGRAEVEINGEHFTPEQISAMILQKLKTDAEAYLGEKVTDAVITVPAYFNDAQRQATKNAGQIAGLNVLRIINEPTAAALAYGLEKKENEKILVFDLGGGTFDVSILEVGEGVFEVKSTNGDTHLGGDDYDRRIVDWLADEFKRDQGIDLRGDRQALQRLTEAAEKVTDAVITVPAYFNDAQRQATKNAGQIAGLNVLRIINEPTAAALAYGLEKKENEKILVFDLGGGTFDVSILEVGEGVFEVKSTNGDTHLGGDDYDRRIVDWLADEFKRDQGIDLRGDRQALQRLTEAAEKAKIELSQRQETEVNLPFITADASGPKHLAITLSRSKFEQLTEDLTARCRGPFEAALKDAGMTASDLNEVILVGGSTRMPVIQELVKSFTNRDPHRGVNPDEVVAVGAAIQAGVLKGEVKDVLLLDVTPLSLGIMTEGEVNTKLIERNTTIPTAKTQVFSTASDSQPSVEIVVLQGERPMARDNRILGTFSLDGIPPAPRGMPQIEVGFDIDANGILNVSAKDRGTGKENKVTITGSTTLQKDEVERMVKEAEVHADEDRKRAESVETRNRADALAYQAEKALADAGDKVPAELRTDIETKVKAVRDAIASNDSDAMKKAHDDLAASIQKIGEAVYAQTQQAQPGTGEPHSGNGDGGAPDEGAGAGAGTGGDDVVDAEFKEV